MMNPTHIATTRDDSLMAVCGSQGIFGRVWVKACDTVTGALGFTSIMDAGTERCSVDVSPALSLDSLLPRS